ncbi:hypothetical protein AAMO2058_000970100 [Amorphochlora amoebiformis]
MSSDRFPPPAPPRSPNPHSPLPIPPAPPNLYPKRISLVESAFQRFYQPTRPKRLSNESPCPPPPPAKQRPPPSPKLVVTHKSYQKGTLDPSSSSLKRVTLSLPRRPPPIPPHIAQSSRGAVVDSGEGGSEETVSRKILNNNSATLAMADSDRKRHKSSASSWLSFTPPPIQSVPRRTFGGGERKSDPSLRKTSKGKGAANADRISSSALDPSDIPTTCPRRRSASAGSPAPSLMAFKGFLPSSSVLPVVQDTSEAAWPLILREGIKLQLKDLTTRKGIPVQITQKSGQCLGWFRACHTAEFQKIREFFSISDQMFLEQLGPQSPEFTIASGGAGRSGAQMWFTRGGKFVIKSMSRAEGRFFHKICPKYSEYMTKQAESLVPKFFAVYSLWLPSPGPGTIDPNNTHPDDYETKLTEPDLKLVVMQNVFETPLDIHLRFDLKGSRVNRSASVLPLRDSDFLSAKGRKPVYKDMDFIISRPDGANSGGSMKSYSRIVNEERWLEGEAVIPDSRKIRIGPLMKRILMQQLLLDTTFLQSLGIMDYSFLLGIHNVSKTNIRKGPAPTRRTLIPLKRLDKEARANLVNKMMNQSISLASSSPTSPSTPTVAAGPSPTSPEGKSSGKKPYVSMFHRDFGGIRSQVFKAPKCPSAPEPKPAPPASPPPKDPKPSVPEEEYQQIYFFGLIDCLQTYTTAKMAETGLKGIVFDWKEVSSVPPSMYAKRFLNFINSIVN